MKISNFRSVESIAAKQAGMKYAVALSCCTAALHLCVKFAGEKIYGKPPIGVGALAGRRVACSDMTFAATLNPVVYEGGIPVFIDTEYDSWNMDPVALEKALEMYPDIKLVVCAELYGFSGNIKKIKEICEAHGALLIEDAAEAMGATWEGQPFGSFGDFAAVSYNGNKIITGSSGGCLLTNDLEVANKARKWSTQARENAAWYQHEEVGYNYRMSNVIAGVIRGQYDFLYEHIAGKKAVYERYKEGLKGLPIQMNPFDEDRCVPNYWLSSLIIDKEAMCRQVRSDTDALFVPERGKSCPTEILEAISSINAEGRPIWKPMHLQPVSCFHQHTSTNLCADESLKHIKAYKNAEIWNKMCAFLQFIGRHILSWLKMYGWTNKLSCLHDILEGRTMGLKNIGRICMDDRISSYWIDEHRLHMNGWADKHLLSDIF